MGVIDLQVDPSLKVEFIDESIEALDAVSNLLISLENAPSNMELIEEIFRPVHTMKGNASFFGLIKVTELAHELETVLDNIRTGQAAINKITIDSLLLGIDTLNCMFHRVLQNESEIESAAEYEELLRTIQHIQALGKDDEELLWKQLLSYVVDDPEILKIGGKLAQTSDAGRWAFHAVCKPPGKNAPQFMQELYVQFTNKENKPDFNRCNALILECHGFVDSEEIQQYIDSMILELKLLANTIGIGDGVTRASMVEHLIIIADKAQWSMPESPKFGNSEISDSKEKVQNDVSKVEENTTAEAPINQEKTQLEKNKTMRIPEKSIDTFLSLVGELVTVREMYSYLYVNLHKNEAAHTEAVNMYRINGMLDDLSNTLLKSVMEIRKLPMGGVLDKMNRIVRDVAKVKSKEIHVEIKGKELMVDKSLIDILEAPLVHMVRNAADHGIELPDIRNENGKLQKGTISISAESDAGVITLTIKDDGAGINVQALEKKARSMGIIGPKDTLKEGDLIDLLFRPGVSTAQEVSDVSGRGVGMDVVRQNIVQAGGTISVDTKDNAGSIFTIAIPSSVSTQVINGYIVNEQNSKFVLPVKQVISCYKPEKNQYCTVKGTGEGVLSNNQVIPLVRFSSLYLKCTKEKSFDTLKDKIIVELELTSGPIAVAVDSVDSISQMVVKKIAGVDEVNTHFTGGALMGDGTVAMIIDMERFQINLNDIP
ncbi:MAG: ATP-binding protein [Fibrobacterales bacterium]